jgi:membrane protease YdiL (CAAX protease family)
MERSHDSRPTSSRPGHLKRTLRYFLVFLLWNLIVSVVVLWGVQPQRSGFETAIALVLMLALAAGLLHLYLLRSGTEAAGERRVALRLAPLPPGSLRWLGIAVPVVLLLSWSLGEVYVRVVPVPEHALDPFGELLEGAHGRLLLAVMAIGVAPWVEEFFFRGLVQSELQGRWGPVMGMVGGAALFAVVHFLPWLLPLHLLLGLAFGYAVYATGSIWAGVALHAANNVAAYVLIVLEQEEPGATPTVWEVGVTPRFLAAAAMLVVALHLALWVGRRLWEAGREARLPPPAAAP